jgi:hypothetical protein
MPKQNLDWDKIPRINTYDNFKYKFSARIPHLPTMFSPDGSQVYLCSQDIVVDVNDIEMLQSMFRAIEESMQMEIELFDWSVNQIFSCENDYMIVWSLLDNLDALPDDYRFPEYHIRKLWAKIKLRR